MPVFKKAKRDFSARTLVLGFLIIIAVGTLLLFLPVSSKSGQFTSIFDCLFTSTSAACVTGLAVVDTWAHWSIFGQVVIALLVQVGAFAETDSALPAWVRHCLPGANSYDELIAYLADALP